MKVKVLKGTNQIGGCVTEITSDNGKKIIIDFGEDLPDEEKEHNHKFELEGLTYGEKKYEAVFITHSHGDHIGLIESVLKEIPIYIEETSINIFKKTKMYTTREFDSKYSMDKNNFKTFKFTQKEPIEIDDFSITPYKADHSAYNSAMFLIECNGKKILHTGDFRTHGRIGYTIDNIIEKVGSVDCVVTEGTSLGRSESEYMSEEQLQEELTTVLQEYEQVFVLQSSTNIDRITTFYKARGKKAFVMDQFTCEITSLVNRSIPNPIGNEEGQKYCGIFTYKPMAYSGEREIAYNNSIWYDKDREYNGFKNQDYILMVKSSMIRDIKNVYDKSKKAVLVYSMWEGYIEKQDSMKKFLEEVKNLGINVIIKHTSGHADINTLKNFDKKLKHPMVIPIHTNNVEEARKVFKNAKILNDNEEIEIMKEENEMLKLMLKTKERYLRIRKDELIVYKNGGKMLRQTKNEMIEKIDTIKQNDLMQKVLDIYVYGRDENNKTFNRILCEKTSNSNTSQEVKVYYRAIEMFTVTCGPKSKKIKINDRILKINTLNYDNTEKLQKIIENAFDESEIEVTAFKKSQETQYYYASFDMTNELKNSDEKESKVQTFIKAIESKIENCRLKDIYEKSTYDKEKLRFRFKSNKISFSQLLEIGKIFVEVQESEDNKVDKKKCFKSRALYEKIEVKKKIETNDDIKELGNTMCKLIDNYIDNNKGSYTQKFEEDGVLKSSARLEKEFQNNLMLKGYMIPSLNEEDPFITQSPFNKDTRVIEAEYRLYGQSRKDRSSGGMVGNIDNVFVDVKNNKIMFTELKFNKYNNNTNSFDAGALNGSNGIHKHLVDILIALEHNKNIYEDLTNRIKNTNKMLEVYGDETKNTPQYIEEFSDKYKFDKTEFIILCGIDKFEEDAIKSFKEMLKKILDNTADIHSGENTSLLRVDHKEKSSMELISEIKENNCEVKVYVVDEDFNNFEEYKV